MTEQTTWNPSGETPVEPTTPAEPVPAETPAAEPVGSPDVVEPVVDTPAPAEQPADAPTVNEPPVEVHGSDLPPVQTPVASEEPRPGTYPPTAEPIPVAVGNVVDHSANVFVGEDVHAALANFPPDDRNRWRDFVSYIQRAIAELPWDIEVHIHGNGAVQSVRDQSQTEAAPTVQTEPAPVEDETTDTTVETAPETTEPVPA